MKIAIILALVLTQNALAASSGTLSLSGSVAAVNSIAITPNGTNNTSLNITGGQAGLNIASAQESSNDVAGYKVYMSSANAGQLRNGADASKFTTYTISYSGGPYVSPPASASPVQVKNVASLSGLTTNTSAILINVTAAPNAVAGTYTDTVTLAIVGN